MYEELFVPQNWVTCIRTMRRLSMVQSVLVQFKLSHFEIYLLYFKTNRALLLRMSKIGLESKSTVAIALCIIRSRDNCWTQPTGSSYYFDNEIFWAETRLRGVRSWGKALASSSTQPGVGSHLWVEAEPCNWVCGNKDLSCSYYRHKTELPACVTFAYQALQEWTS